MTTMDIDERTDSIESPIEIFLHAIQLGWAFDRDEVWNGRRYPGAFLGEAERRRDLRKALVGDYREVLTNIRKQYPRDNRGDNGERGDGTECRKQLPADAQTPSNDGGGNPLPIRHGEFGVGILRFHSGGYFFSNVVTAPFSPASSRFR